MMSLSGVLMKSRCFVFFILSVAGPALAQSQPPAAPTAQKPSGTATTPRFPSEIEFVNVDVVVTEKGVPVTGLKESDFTILEDGVPQTVTGFDAVELPAMASSAPPPMPAVSTNVGAGEHKAGRSFVVFYDDIHMSPLQAHRAKAAVAEFITKGTREGDRVSLVASGGGAWWTARMESGRQQLLDLLKRLEGRHIRPPSMMDQMSDWEALRIHIYHDQSVADKVFRRFQSMGVNMQSQQDTDENRQPADFDPYVSMKALETYEESRRRNQITLDVLQRAVLSLAQGKGRKSLILVSEGFIYDMQLDEFKRVLHAARTANVAIYFLDTRGLGGLPSTFSAEFGPPTDPRDIGSSFLDTMMEGEGSETLADESGGFTVKNTNDLGAGIQRIANESRAYYMLGYSSTNPEKDGKWRKIQVKVNRKGLTVRARRGYYAPLQGAPSALTARKQQDDKVDQAFQEALDAPGDLEGVPLRMTSYVLGETILGKATTAIVADVDINNFQFTEKDGRLTDTMELLLVAAHRETGEYYRYDQKIEMNLKPETRQKLLQSWYSILRDFELPPGGYQAKIVVRDGNGGKVGTVTHEFDVPELGSWRVSTLILTDSLVPPAQGQPPTRPVALARRAFKPAGMLFGQFEVYGATKDKVTLFPKVKAGYVVKAKDGTELARAQPTTINPTAQGGVSRMFGFPIEGYRPGLYDLVLTVTDEVSGQTKEIKESFQIDGGAAAAPAASAEPAAPGT
jgi:VWFA-related protein